MSHEESDALLRVVCTSIVAKKYEEALELVNKVIETDAEYCDAWLYKGVVLEWQGKDDEALVCHQKALGLDPKYYDAYMQMGHIYLKQGKADIALESFCSACLVNKTHDSEFWKGHAAYKVGKYAAAVVAFEEALKYGGDYVVHANEGLGLIAEIYGNAYDAGECLSD